MKVFFVKWYKKVENDKFKGLIKALYERSKINKNDEFHVFLYKR